MVCRQRVSQFNDKLSCVHKTGCKPIYRRKKRSFGPYNEKLILVLKMPTSVTVFYYIDLVVEPENKIYLLYGGKCFTGN